MSGQEKFCVRKENVDGMQVLHSYALFYIYWSQWLTYTSKQFYDHPDYLFIDSISNHTSDNKTSNPQTHRSKKLKYSLTNLGEICNHVSNQHNHPVIPLNETS